MAGISQSSPSTALADPSSTAIIAAETKPTAPGPTPLSRDPNRENLQSAKPVSPSKKLSLATSNSATHATLQSQTSKHSSGAVAAPPVNTQRYHHLSSPSTSSQRSSGILAFAQAALDKTLANIAEPRVRTRQSLSRLSTGPDLFFSGVQSPTASGDGKPSGLPSALKDPPSQPYSETDPTRPPPIYGTRQDNKMHQTSSRLLRMTDDDRPFTKVSLSQVF